MSSIRRVNHLKFVTNVITAVVELSNGSIVVGTQLNQIVQYFADGTNLQFGPTPGYERLPVVAIIELNTTRLLTASRNKTITLWMLQEVDNNNYTVQRPQPIFLTILRGHYDAINCMLMIRSPHHNNNVNVSSGSEWLIATGARDDTIRLWKVTANGTASQSIRSLSGHSGDVWSVCELHDGTIASGSLDHKIKIWNLQSGRAKLTLVGHSDSVVGVVELHRMILLSLSYDGHLRKWCAESGSCLQTIKISSDWTAQPYMMHKLMSGSVVLASTDLKIRGWYESGVTSSDNETRQQLQVCFEIKNLPSKVGCFAVGKRGRLIAGLQNGNIDTWEVPFNTSLVFSCCVCLVHHLTLSDIKGLVPEEVYELCASLV
eukprot:TRINITY_DN4042_c0_g1_i1.p1 TRINITY_DN4042_c0_g1~~TRINITY_DN4042_c0_g1_i1.p1  ORF type:complete len:374 (+),score=61.09 TRINITY_DN4042_c0_g1_i1:10-1131(+)